MSEYNLEKLTDLTETLRTWAYELGFQQLGITGVDLPGEYGDYLQKWLDAGYHGEMSYMAQHGSKRYQPDELIPGTCTVLSLRMDYLPSGADPETILADSEKAYISRYALGRDYHKLMRSRLATLAKKIEAELNNGQYRAFVDSAPVLERAIAEQSGLGWIAKNTMLINDKAGSWFFLGEIYTDIPFPTDLPKKEKHCGTCTACLEVCPTNAFPAPFVLDARRCISYLTIEHPGVIDPELRPLMGNRIYGCDDCQLCCPWNKFARPTDEADFSPRQKLDDVTLVELFSWSAQEFNERTLGSPIRRIGYARWLRNIAIALGNAKNCNEVVAALNMRAREFEALKPIMEAGDTEDFGIRVEELLMIEEHIVWALERHGHKI